MLTANATGTEKLKPLVIGSSIEPRALARLNYDALPVTYRANLKAWMRTDIFCEWLTELDRKLRLENRHILLLVDNASSHYDPNESNDESNGSNESNGPNESNSQDTSELVEELSSEEQTSNEESESENSDDEESHASSSRTSYTRRGRPRLNASNINNQSRQDSLRGRGRGRGYRRGRGRGHGRGRGLKQVSSSSKGRRGCARPYTIPDPSGTRLTNIQIEFLPPHTTAHLQPMDAGIINSFKAKYKRKYIQHIMNQFEKGEDLKK